MNIELVDDPDLIRQLGYPKDQDRTFGVVHQSEIIKRLMQRPQPKRFGTGAYKDTAQTEIGILFETMLERALVAKFATSRPGELVSDEGVYMSPDGVNPSLLAGEEYKATFMSYRDGITDENGQPKEKYLHWFFQMKGYAKWLGVVRYLLRVLFVCGDYSRPLTPVFKTFDIVFTQDEVDENWTMLMNFARSEEMLP